MKRIHPGRGSLVLLVVLAIGMIGCDYSAEPESAPVGPVVITPDSKNYVLQVVEDGGIHGEGSYSVSIPYKLANGTGVTVYLPNCHNDTFEFLMREVDGEWVGVETSTVSWTCASPPISLKPEARYLDTLDIIYHPSMWDPPSALNTDLPGWFKIHGHTVLTSFDSEAYDGTELPDSLVVTEGFNIRFE